MPSSKSRDSSTSSRGAHLEGLAREVVEVHRAAPAVVLAGSHRTGGAWRTEIAAWGRLGALGDEPPATAETPFDLASVTKPLVALTLARLVRRGRLAWTTPLGSLLAEARGTLSEGASVELLLAHRAGLESHRPLYAPLLEGRSVDRALALREAAAARRGDATGLPSGEGFAPVYSDLGYLLVGEAISRLEGRDLDEVIEREVLLPLGLGMGSAAQLSARDGTFTARVAPTEVVPWRGGAVRGMVHDENAWALSGTGASGHAGLFGTAETVVRLGQAVLDVFHGRMREFLARGELVPLVRPRPGGTLRAGFDGKSETGSSAGTKFGAASIGHLGFTGTSVWLDPEREIVGVLLTNRVHPSRASDAIRQVRPLVYDALWDWSENRGE